PIKATWLGGAYMAADPAALKTIQVTRQEYLEHGSGWLSKPKSLKPFPQSILVDQLVLLYLPPRWIKKDGNPQWSKAYFSLDDQTNAQQSKSQNLAVRDPVAAPQSTQTAIKQEKPAELDVNAQSAPHRCNPNEQSKKRLPEIQHSGVTITDSVSAAPLTRAVIKQEANVHPTPLAPEQPSSSQRPYAAKTAATPQSTSIATKQGPYIDQSLMSRERLLRQAALASIGRQPIHPRNEMMPMPLPAPLDNRQPLASDTKPWITRSHLALGPKGRLNLHDVEENLASLNRHISSSACDVSKQQRFLHEKERVLKVWRQLSMENLQKKHGGLNPSNASHPSYTIDRYTPNDPHPKHENPMDRYTPASSSKHAPTSDHQSRKRSGDDGALDRYVPADRYALHPRSRGAAEMTKRPRESSPEEDVEVMTEAITEVNRITKRISGLGDRPGQQKRRKLTTQGLGVALRGSVEELLAKTWEIFGP
ncbi:MAG: hypothetical protein Q9192_008287, partial [Flavoplaca navasiana]